MNLKFYDITPAISRDIAVFPGDQLMLSSILTTLHVGPMPTAPITMIQTAVASANAI